MADVGKQTTEPLSGERSFVARQPILDDRHHVFAYELLCRDVGSPAAHGVDATARTLDAAALSIGLDELTSGRLAFIEISRDVLLSDVATLLRRRRHRRAVGARAPLAATAAATRVGLHAEDLPEA